VQAQSCFAGIHRPCKDFVQCLLRISVNMSRRFCKQLVCPSETETPLIEHLAISAIRAKLQIRRRTVANISTRLAECLELAASRCTQWPTDMRPLNRVNRDKQTFRRPVPSQPGDSFYFRRMSVTGHGVFAVERHEQAARACS